MKKLTEYLKDNKSSLISLNEKLIINQRLDEKLIINKNYKQYTYAPKSFKELKKIIEDRYDKLGPGTEQNPIGFNDIDVSNINSFWDEKNKGIFEKTKFEYIDVSGWDVSNAEDMYIMFFECYNLKSVGDLSNWNVSNVKDMYFMFYKCKQLKSVGDLSNWKVSKCKIMKGMFYGCEQLTSVGDLSNWDVSNVKYMNLMFEGSGITNIPNWYKE